MSVLLAPAFQPAAMSDTELLCDQGGIVPGIVRTTKPSGFNLTKLVHFWPKLYRRSLIPVNNRLPHVASEIDLSIGVGVLLLPLGWGMCSELVLKSPSKSHNAHSRATCRGAAQKDAVLRDPLPGLLLPQVKMPNWEVQSQTAGGKHLV